MRLLLGIYCHNSKKKKKLGTLSDVNKMYRIANLSNLNSTEFTTKLIYNVQTDTFFV